LPSIRNRSPARSAAARAHDYCHETHDLFGERLKKKKAREASASRAFNRAAVCLDVENYVGTKPSRTALPAPGTQPDWRHVRVGMNCMVDAL
jgi:hypothetical protein